MRDWAVMETQEDYSRSRCASLGEPQSETCLPFKPKDYNYAPASPNAPNICEKSVQFVIEEQQMVRTIPRPDFQGENKCYVTTEDDAIAMLHTITNPVSYGEKLLLIQARQVEISEEVQAVLPLPATPHANEDFSMYAAECEATV